MRLLLVEDDAMIGAGVRHGLRQEGYTVDWVQDGQLADHALQQEQYDLLLLDLGLPRKSGMEVLRALRLRGHSMPVLVITARDAVEHRVEGLDAGADDYLVKPFDLDELSARVRALIRRQSGRAHPLLTVGELSLDPATHRVQIKGVDIALSSKEFALLRCLMEKPGVVISRPQIEERLYGWGEEVESNAAEVHIHKLRKKLGGDWIRNMRGVGYFVAPPA